MCCLLAGPISPHPLKGRIFLTCLTLGIHEPLLLTAPFIDSKVRPFQGFTDLLYLFGGVLLLFKNAVLNMRKALGSPPTLAEKEPS